MLVAAPIASLASFEMGLILQGQEVHRWDPVSNSYLGNFSLLSSGTGLTSYQSKNEAYVLGGQYVYKYNYNTGEYNGRVSVGSGGVTISRGMTDDEVLIGSAAGVRRHNLSTGAQVGTTLTYTGGGFSYAQGALAMRSTGVYYLLSEATTWSDGHDYLIGVNDSSTWVGNFKNMGTYGNTTSSIRAGDVSGNLAAFITLPFGGPSTAPDVARRNASHTLDYIYDSTLYGTTRTSYLQFGHNESVVMLLGAVSEWYGLRSSYESGFSAPQRLVPGINQGAAIQGFSMIVAPEPGSLAVLALGAWMILRSRTTK